MSASDYAIRIEGLGKQYRLGLEQAGGAYRYKSLRDSLTGLARRPLAAARAAFVREPMDETNSFWALKDVNFEVKRGEVVGIIGRNGAGKSTLLKILSRITKPTTGHIELRGRVGSLLEVGTGFHPELTGRENIFLNGAVLGMTQAEVKSKLDEIIAFSEIENFIDMPVKHYSSGMYMRLAFAVAAHLATETVIIDEVLAVGDAEFQKKCLGKMSDMAGHGRTILFVSHNMGAVMQLCSSAIVLEHGRVAMETKNVSAGVQRYISPVENTAPTSLSLGAGFDKFAEFKPIRFSITDAFGNSATKSFLRNSNVYVEIEANISNANPHLTVGIAVFDQNMNQLFWSYHTDSGKSAGKTLSVGDWRLRCQIPVNLLNPGRYRLELIASLHYQKWFFEPNVSSPSIFFDVSEEWLSDSHMWTAPRPGLFAPELAWSAVRLHTHNDPSR